MTAAVTTLTPAEIPLFIDFIRDCFRPQHILTDPSFVRWQHWTPWDDRSALFVIRDRSGRVIAHDGGVAAPFWADGHRLRARLSMSLMARPEVRGFGLGVRIVRHIMERADATLALAMNREAEALHEGLGFQTFGLLHRYLRVTDPAGAGSLIRPAARMPMHPPVTVPPLGTVFGGPFDERFTRLYERRMTGRFGVARSGEYLNWRYRAMPHFRYEARVVERGQEVDGLLIWRRDATEPAGTVAGRLVELIGEPESCAGLVAAVIQDALRERIAFLDAFFLAPQDGEPLARCGFIEATGDAQRLFPNWTHPLEHTDNPRAYTINAAAYCRLASSAWRDRERWYVTRSDTDQDRPSTIP